MAGDWIKMRNNLWNDPRVSRLCDITGATEATIIGGLYWLWATADEHSEDGSLPHLTLRQIDRKTEIQGFSEALCSIGWIADEPDGIRILRFEEHNGASAKRRCMESQRKANSRSVSASNADSERTASGHGAELEKSKRREDVNPPSLRSGQDEPAGPDCPTGFDADAEDSDDPDKAIHALVWSEGLPLLTDKGVKEKAARGLLGKLCKAVGDLEALAVIEAMRAADPGEPASWLSAAIKRREAENTGTSFADFVAGCKERGEPVVSEYQPLRDYIAEAGLPMPFIEVAWGEFKRRHMLGGTWAQARREDWRRSFLIAVELNAMRLWRIDRGSGEYLLTDIGLQAQKAHANRSAA